MTSVMRRNRRSVAAADDEVRRDQVRRSAGPAGPASRTGWLVSQRTGIINEIRAFLLERSIAVRQGIRSLRAELPRILPDVLSPSMVRIVQDLACDWRRLDERVEGLSNEIETIARQDAGCERLMSVPGIGPIISSAIVAAIGAGDVFTKGRDFAAWLGPRSQADLDRGPYDPRQDIPAWQSLPASSVRAGGVGRADQAADLGAPRAQALARGGRETATSQRAGDRPCQQARPHRLERSGSWPAIRGADDQSGRAPANLILTPH